MELIRYDLLKLQQKDKAVACLAKQFCTAEPITKILKISQRDFSEFAQPIVQQSIEEGLAFAASYNNRIVGTRILVEGEMDYMAPRAMQPIVQLAS